MKIQLNSDKQIVVDAALSGKVESVITKVLQRFESGITRIEVHLSDLNGAKAGFRDKRCQLEARLAGRKPVSVSDVAATVGQAIHRAAHKMYRLLETSLGRALYRTASRPSTRPSTKKSAQGTKRRGIKVAEKPRHLEVIASDPAAIAAPTRVHQKSAGSPPAAGSLAQQGSGNQRRRKKKGIYQARRKRWPRR